MRTVPPPCLFSRKKSILFTPLILSVLYQNNESFQGRIWKSVTYPLNFGLFLLKQRFHGLKNKDFVEDYPHLDQMAFFYFFYFFFNKNLATHFFGHSFRFQPGRAFFKWVYEHIFYWFTLDVGFLTSFPYSDTIFSLLFSFSFSQKTKSENNILSSFYYRWIQWQGGGGGGGGGDGG